MQATGPRDPRFWFAFFALFSKTPFHLETPFRPVIRASVLLLTLAATAPGGRAQRHASPQTSIDNERHGGGGHSALVANPASASISATVGSSSSQTIQLKNSRTSSLTISGVTVPPGGFSITGLSTPLTLSGGEATTLNLVFSPTATGAVSGKLLIANTSGTLSLAVSGTGIAASESISVSPTSLSFGNVTVGTSASGSVTLTSSGNASVTIAAVSVSGTGFSVSGNWNGTILNAGQTAPLNMEFTPTAGGNVTGSVTVTSNATNSPTTIALSGTGVVSTSYSVELSWSPSVSSGVTGYNVYRGTVSGGPYSKIDLTPVSGLTYTDTNVQAGPYYYVVTSLTSSGLESGYSAQVAASVP